MIAGSPGIEDLKRRHPEWAPWLTLVAEALRESTNGAWTSVVPAPAPSTPATPALSGSAVVVPEKLLRALLERLASVAARGRPSRLATLTNMLGNDLDLAGLFHASVTQDARRADEIASSRGVDAEALQAAITLLGLPFLQACRTQWASAGGTSWMEGYCPICGAWPAFAEVRGVARSRFNRCGRCGSEWHAHILQCAYCRTTKHEELVALVPEREARGAVDACRRCGGYLKVFTRLQGCPPSAVMLDDLASVNLDVAALDAGYTRPPGAGSPPAISVHIAAGRRFLAWKA